MSDKKLGSKLKQVQLTEKFKDQVFPTRQKDMHAVLQATDDSGIVCYVCMDTVPGPVTSLHVYVPPEQRTCKKIMRLTELFYELIHPWCKDRGYTHILFSCAGDDQKTTDFAIAAGFKPENINMALMPVT
jgi:hypothetical protein